MDEKIVPLISSSVAGPLGILHLPRLWLKILLHASGLLPEGYRHGAGGFDETLCANLGIDRDVLVSFIEIRRPDYLELEEWVKSNARNLNEASIAKHNAEIASRNMPSPLLEQRRTELGIADPSMTNAILLNNLEDWSAVHRRLR
jgi:hypothetical protein